jgi:hypothetical protein
MEVLRPTAQPLGSEVSPYQRPLNQEWGQGVNQSNSSIDFGGSPNHNKHVNFSGQPPQLTTSKSPGNGQPSQDDELMALVRDLVQQISQLLLQFMQQNQNGNTDPGKSNSKDASLPSNGNTSRDPTSPPNAQNVAVTPPSVSEATPSGQTNAPGPVDGTPTSDSNTLVGSSLTAGSGPYSLNISNTQDHEIKIGQFDQKENLIGEITLAPKGQPGSTGTMKYQADTTTLIKQADEDGQYRPDASRLEAYNGFINTSYIDGRNASIHASDGKGFEIGDSKSIAEAAKREGLINNVDDTLPGWYDGSTSEMQKGGKFLEDELGTGDSYIHPNDDQLGPGKNPMRHTDSMTLNVEFGKA